MTSTQHAIVGYILGLALLWGYALSLWLRHRAVK
jgi:hypothetical protein